MIHLPLGTYPKPRHGWTCFHCGETFREEGAARAHFGPTPSWDPACVDRLKHSDQELLQRTRQAELDAEKFRDARDSAIAETEQAQGELSSLWSRFPGHSVHDVWCSYESVEGRALAAEAIIVEASKLAPDVIEKAREIVCAPVTASA